MGTRDAEQTTIAATLYRRLPMQWWESAVKKGNLHHIPVSRFKPNKNDSDGLSVSRALISSFQVASTTAKGKQDCLAEFPVSVVTNRNLTVKPMPTDRDPGHAIIPEMNYAALQNPDTEIIVEEHAHALAKASRIVWPTDNDPRPQK